MMRRFLRKLFKTTVLAFALSTTIIPAAAATQVSAEGGAGATPTPSLDAHDGW